MAESKWSFQQLLGSLKCFFFYKTKRLSDAVCLFSNISQRKSNCDRNISDTLSCTLCHLFILTTFWYHQLSITGQTHGNMYPFHWVYGYLVARIFQTWGCTLFNSLFIIVTAPRHPRVHNKYSVKEYERVPDKRAHEDHIRYWDILVIGG